jgi:hypothetical protein
VGSIQVLSALNYEGVGCDAYPGSVQSDCCIHPNASKDYEASLAAQLFLEKYAGY